MKGQGPVLGEVFRAGRVQGAVTTMENQPVDASDVE